MFDRILNTPEFFLAAIAALIWLVRLEGKMSNTKESLKELKIKHEALDSKIIDKLSLIEQSLARLEGRLSVTSKEEG